MKARQLSFWALTAVVLTFQVEAVGQTPLGTGFTYQGQLKQAGSPVNEATDFVFKLYDAETAGNLIAQVGDEFDPVVVDVVDGLFTVELDFGADAFNGADARWLEIAVAVPGGGGSFTTLSPRQPLTPAPFALQTRGITVAPNGNVGIGDTSDPYRLLTIVDEEPVIGTTVLIDVYRPSQAGQASLSGRFTRGTAALPGIVQENDRLFGLSAAGYDGSGVDFAQAGIIDFWVDGAPGPGDMPGRIEFSTTPDGSTTPVERVRIDSNGNVGIGTMWPAHKLHVETVGDDALYAHTTATDGTAFAIRALAEGNGGMGVYGLVHALDSVGVMGEATAGSGVSYGVLGQTSGTVVDYGVFSNGNFAASGTKSFQIDHPLDPDNKYLRHYCTEGPEPLNMYRGNAVLDDRGEAWVELPRYFEQINRDFHYLLTPIGGAAPNLHVAQELRDNRFKIGGGQPRMKVSWTVTGVRNDPFVRAYGAPVEQDKSEQHRGKYLRPELYGQPKQLGIHYVGEAAMQPAIGKPEELRQEE